MVKGAAKSPLSVLLGLHLRVPWASVTEGGSEVSPSPLLPRPKLERPQFFSFGVRSQPLKLLIITVSGAFEHCLLFRDWAGTQDQAAPPRPFIRKTTWRPLLVEEAIGRFPPGVQVKNAAPSLGLRIADWGLRHGTGTVASLPSRPAAPSSAQLASCP